MLRQQLHNCVDTLRSAVLLGVLGVLLPIVFVTLVVAQPYELLILEIDYDQPGPDNAEWVEIMNATDVLFNTDGVDLVLYDADLSGTCTEYCRVDLSPVGAIAEYQRVVIGAHPCALLPLCTGVDAIQNGVPDAIALENANGELIHSVEYASDLTNSVCNIFDRTTVSDSDSNSGSIQFCLNSPPFGWQFRSSPTPCQPCDDVTDVPFPPQTTPNAWGAVKMLYRE